MPPLCKGRWHAKRDRGVVKAKFHRKTIPHPTSSGAPFAQGSLGYKPTNSEFIAMIADHLILQYRLNRKQQKTPPVGGVF